MKVLATDLDGTFLGGRDLHRQQLYKFLQERSDILLVFVTGRGLESVLSLLEEGEVPYPDYIICDVGATIVNAHTMEPIAALQAEIDRQWPGETVVLEALKGIPGLTLQDVPQQRRCSFLVEDAAELARIPAILDVLQCDMIYSADRYLDILPKGVNKGSSLKGLVKLLELKPQEVFVAGDTLNDLAMYQCGFPGVVVGNAERGLVEATRTFKDISYAKTAGAGGILEAFAEFEQLQHPERATDLSKF